MGRAPKAKGVPRARKTTTTTRIGGAKDGVVGMVMMMQWAEEEEEARRRIPAWTITVRAARTAGSAIRSFVLGAVPGACLFIPIFIFCFLAFVCSSITRPLFRTYSESFWFYSLLIDILCDRDVDPPFIHTDVSKLNFALSIH